MGVREAMMRPASSARPDDMACDLRARYPVVPWARTRLVMKAKSWKGSVAQPGYHRPAVPIAHMGRVGN